MGKRTRSQRRGSSPKNRVNSHRFPAFNKLPRKTDEVATIIDLIHSPAHTAPLAKLKFEDGTIGHFAAPEGTSVGQNIAFGENVTLRPGNVTTLDRIPEGTPVCNVELRPGDGGKFAKSGGNSAILETRMEDTVRVRLPSGKLKELHSKCRATIGILGGHGRTDKPLMKAGAAHHRAKARGKLYPTVSGVAMNPVDHPHGGGNHQAVHGPNSVSRNSPPGMKVGNIAPSRTGRGRRKE
ncbi:MAG: 50S ribosomal protein L2 [Euryarchaeota archaeon]|jgi:large subunit ribosomal protein L2|nr:50S ribosomal protein L2 [Euryarchaeota archaeon]MCP2506797.1 50S ribosomal protein L2 [Candidatus Thalassarchaeaceae archaeon]MBT4803065.1 50S ribosomal protein L2 [Euryarchaeota archaeon]MBT5613518.1 50S ribosomal protein L2 [Euryarchaeota archaeon]MBT6684456.1 50S ribosomal protein L2 [Euryarchaeota archaeon]